MSAGLFDLGIRYAVADYSVARCELRVTFQNGEQIYGAPSEHGERAWRWQDGKGRGVGCVLPTLRAHKVRR